MRVLVVEDEAKLAAHICVCAKNYFAKVCKTKYDICMKSGQRKDQVRARRMRWSSRSPPGPQSASGMWPGMIGADRSLRVEQGNHLLRRKSPQQRDSEP